MYVFIAFPNYFGRYATDNCVVGHILCNYSSGTYDSSPAYMYTGQDAAANPNPCIVVNMDRLIYETEVR